VLDGLDICTPAGELQTAVSLRLTSKQPHAFRSIARSEQPNASDTNQSAQTRGAQTAMKRSNPTPMAATCASSTISGSLNSCRSKVKNC
jgi:hypothetical protein